MGYGSTHQASAGRQLGVCALTYTLTQPSTLGGIFSCQSDEGQGRGGGGGGDPESISGEHILTGYVVTLNNYSH